MVQLHPEHQSTHAVVVHQLGGHRPVREQRHSCLGVIGVAGFHETLRDLHHRGGLSHPRTHMAPLIPELDRLLGELELARMNRLRTSPRHPSDSSWTPMRRRAPTSEARTSRFPMYVRRSNDLSVTNGDIEGAAAERAYVPSRRTRGCGNRTSNEEVRSRWPRCEDARQEWTHLLVALGFEQGGEQLQLLQRSIHTRAPPT